MAAAKKRKVNIFDMLRYLTHGKKPWEKLTLEEQKMGPFMLNKWLSMDADLLPPVNQVERYTSNGMSTEMVYKLYYDLLPNVKFYFRYIKGKTADKYNANLVAIVSTHLQVSKSEAIESMGLIEQLPNYKILLTEFLSMYGKNAKEIKVLLK